MIGLALAEALSRRGAEVVLLEGGQCGKGASAGNGGWVTPGLASPIPAPGAVGQATRWMLNPRSPFLIRPVPRASFARWTFDFWRATKPRAFSAGMAAMMALSRRILDDYDALAERCSFEMHDDGLLFVGRSERSVRAQEQLFRECRALGYEGEVVTMSRAEAVELEPALVGDFAGAVYAADERYVRPETVSAGLAAELRRRGVELRENAPVHELARSGEGWALRTDAGAVEVDRVVVAAGAATRDLLAPLGVKLPVERAKGYSLTADDPPVRFRESVYLLESRVGVTPFDRGVRLGGTLELGSRGLGLSRNRIAAIEGAARAAFGEWTEGVQWRPWAGFRTLLPDGLPALGPVPGHGGLHVATGHGMVGVTLAPTTAEVVAPAVLGDAPPLQLAPFSIARFDNRGQVPQPTPAPKGT